MICDISNAYPHNISVDAEHDFDMGCVFWGDKCTRVDFRFYDATNKSEDPKIVTRYIYDRAKIYYNGEEIDVTVTPERFSDYLFNGRTYLWRARMYDGTVDIDAGLYPECQRDTGEIQTPSYMVGTVQKKLDGVATSLLCIEKGLDLTLPMWIRIGTDEVVRKVLDYERRSGMMIIGTSPLTTIPDAGTPYYLSTNRDYIPTETLAENQITILPKLSSLSSTSFVADTGEGSTEYCWYIKIGEEYRAITGYNKHTGVLTLEKPFTTTPAAGTRYTLYTIYTESQCFTFNTRPTPYFTNCVATQNCENLHFKADVSAGTRVKYYWWDIYEGDELVETTKNIYMSKCDYYFKKAIPGKTYKGVIHIVTQDGMVNQEDSEWWEDGTPTNETGEYVFCAEPTSHNMYANIRLRAGYNALLIMIGGLDKGTFFRLLRHVNGKTEWIGDFNKNTIFDYKAAAGVVYSYTIIPYRFSGTGTNKTATVFEPITTEEVCMESQYWSLYGLTTRAYEPYTNDNTRINYAYLTNETIYHVIDFWECAVDLNRTQSITQNINRSVSTGETAKPVAVFGKNNYDSFSLSFVLCELYCGYGHYVRLGDSKIFDKWKKFVANSPNVMIKDIDGNVWFGAITSSQCDKTRYNGGKVEYRVTIEFTELEDLSNVFVENNIGVADMGWQSE